MELKSDFFTALVVVFPTHIANTLVGVTKFEFRIECSLQFPEQFVRCCVFFIAILRVINLLTVVFQFAIIVLVVVMLAAMLFDEITRLELLF